MAKYKLLLSSYIPRKPGGQPERLPVGAEIEFDGVPGSNLELVSGKPKDEREELVRKAKSMRVKGVDFDKASIADLRKAIKEKASSSI